MRQLSNGGVEIVVDPDHGFIRRQTYETALGRSEEVIARVASNAAVTMRNIGRVDGDSILSASLQGGITTAWAKIPGIKITGRYKVVESGKILTPDFWSGGRNSSGDGIELSLPWAAHPAMGLYFVVTMDRPNGNFRVNNVYVVGSDASGGIKGWLLPPFANLYEDGRVCMGNEPVKCCPTISDQWSAALAHFSAARFNSDLSSRISQAVVSQQIRFQAADNKQLPVPDNWATTWQRVNSTIYSAITP